MKKKIFLVAILLITLMANISMASYSTVTMSVVEEPVCKIEIGANSNFEKKLVEKDLNNKEVTIQLKVTNEEEAMKPKGEIVLLIDNSLSMEEQTDTGTKRRDVIFESAKTFLKKALTDNNSLKVAISRFSTNTDAEKEGTIEDAGEVTPLTNDLNTLLQGIESIKTDGPRTNLDSGLKVASTQFSNEENNKYLVILTDGVPNVAVDYDKNYFSQDVINKTKAQLQALETQGINVITMLTGINNENSVPITGFAKTYKQIITEIFGTAENPTVGKFFYIKDSQVEDTILRDIYYSLLPVQKEYTDIKIVDYFPADIVNNFEFAYVQKANIGEISTEIDKTNNSITWTIPKLAAGETAIVQYKLKLKEDFDDAILDKLIDTNEKVDISYKDPDNKEESKTSDITPVLKLEESKDPKDPEDPQNPQNPPKDEQKPQTPSVEEQKPGVLKLPMAGSETIISVALVGATIFAVYSFIKMVKINKDMK